MYKANWAWAAAKTGDVPVFTRELDALVKLSEKNDTFMELYRPEDGKPDGSPRQLWSASGFLSMIYHGLFGMEFIESGVWISPVVPHQFQKLVLENVHYRDAQLRIVVKGNGRQVLEFKLDGKSVKPFFAASQKGAHEVEILMR